MVLPDPSREPGSSLVPRRRSTGLRCAVTLALVATIATPTLATPAESDPGADATWKWGPSVLLYVLRDESDYLQPTLTADRGGLHLEARYNYEDRRTGSIFAGWNFSFGEEVTLGLTPMLGGVFGQTNGIAPALTLTLEWGPLALWSQSEMVFDLGDTSASFFYAWSELSVSFLERLRAGLALQRTRVFQTEREVEVGPFVGVSIWKLTATAYVFAPGQDGQYVVVAVAGSF